MASVPEMVSNTTLGKMRYEWWREALQASTPPQHPLALALHGLRNRVPAYHLKRILDARADDRTLGR